MGVKNQQLAEGLSAGHALPVNAHRGAAELQLVCSGAGVVVLRWSAVAEEVCSCLRHKDSFPVVFISVFCV